MVRLRLMDEQTLNTFSAFSRHDAPKSPVGHLPGLTETEQAFFDSLNEHQLRLEQEHIPLSYVRAVLASLL